MSCKSLVAFKISEMVTGELFRIKTLFLYAIFSVADLFEGLILLTTLIAAEAKNLLKDSAISDGSLILAPLTIKEAQFFLLFLGLQIELDKICQVLRKFFALFSI